ncbi:MAG: GYF domain-containing protein [Planctomycetota bacterium]|nr:GYF domain-containing protein [Planctomycetota bacterium]
MHSIASSANLTTEVGYFVRRGMDATKGPYPAGYLRRMARAGKLRPTDEVQPEGATRWYKAWRVSDFGFAKPSAPIAVICEPKILPSLEVAPAPLPVAKISFKLVGDSANDVDSTTVQKPVDRMLAQTFEIQGLKLEPEPGEKLVGTIAQDPTDALVCGWGAFIKRLRGAVIATDRRFIVCRPRGAGMEYHVIERTRVTRVSLEQHLVGRRAVTVAITALASIGLGAWAAIARTPTTFAMAAEGATAFGIAAALSIVTCVLVGRMRHPSLILRVGDEKFDLPCQRADRHVVMRMGSLIRSSGAFEDHADELVSARKRDSRGRVETTVQLKPHGSTDDFGDVGPVMTLEQAMLNRAAS